MQHRLEGKDDIQGVQTRERILDAAEALFAESGYASTSVRDITAEAGCNLASVNYHFGGKHNLYIEVFKRRMSELRAQRISGFRRGISGSRGAPKLERVIESFVSAFLEPLVDDDRGRRMMQLFHREMVDPELPEGMFVNNFVEPLLGSFVEVLMGVRPGITKATAVLCIQSMVGQLLHWLFMRRAFMGREAMKGLADQSTYMSHMVKFSSAGIRAVSREAGK